MTNRTDVSIVLKYDFADCLRKCIDMQLAGFNDDDDETKLYLSALWELRQRINIRMATATQSEYRLKLSACQAFALRILFSCIEAPPSPWFGNELRMIADTIHRHYS